MNKKYAAIYIALGANLSNPQETFSRAMLALENKTVDVKAVSGLWQSPAWPPGSHQPDYINAVIKITTGLTPIELLDVLQDIEKQHGRKRGGERWGPRTLDLDIILFNNLNLRFLYRHF